MQGNTAGLPRLWFLHTEAVFVYTEEFKDFQELCLFENQKHEGKVLGSESTVFLLYVWT